MFEWGGNGAKKEYDANSRRFKELFALAKMEIKQYR
jgi:hypothetical protein